MTDLGTRRPAPHTSSTTCICHRSAHILLIDDVAHTAARCQEHLQEAAVTLVVTCPGRVVQHGVPVMLHNVGKVQVKERRGTAVTCTLVARQSQLMMRRTELTFVMFKFNMSIDKTMSTPQETKCRSKAFRIRYYICHNCE